MKRLPRVQAWVLADMACDVAAFRAAAEAMGAIPMVPSRRNAKQKQSCPVFIHRHHNLIERCWSRMKKWRAIAARYDRIATSHAAGIVIAATLDWFKSPRRMAFECEQAIDAFVLEMTRLGTAASMSDLRWRVRTHLPRSSRDDRYSPETTDGRLLPHTMATPLVAFHLKNR